MESQLARMAWTQVWQVALLAAAVWLATRLVARNRPHLAHGLWLVVLFKCVTPPFWSSPSGLFCWLQPVNQPTSESTSQRLPRAASGAREQQLGTLAPHELELAGVDPRIADGVRMDVPQPVEPVSPPQVEVVAAEFSATDHGAAVRHRGGPSTAHGGRRTAWKRVREDWLYVWFSVAAVWAVVTAIRYAACSARLRRNGQVDVSSLAHTLSELSTRLRLRRTPRLVVTNEPVGPAVVGVLRPTVVLPAALVDRCGAAGLAPILAHELIHIRRGDLWVGLLQIITRALWWFHPLVWLAAARVTREAERSCDEEVIAELALAPGDYARRLVDVLELKRTLKPFPALAGVRPVEITFQRLERIMRLEHGCTKRTPWWC